MHDFFYLWDREAENWKGGNFDKFLKRQKILTPVFEQEARMFPSKIYRTRIETANLTLRKCIGKDFFSFFLFTFQKLIKPKKLMIFALNVRPVSNPRIKAIGYV